MTQLTTTHYKREPVRQFRVYLDGARTTVRVDGDQIEKYYLPLSRWIIGLRRSSGRLVIGVAGPPGSGKTVLSSILASMINTGHGTDRAVVIGLDGWHLPNAYLSSHYAELGGSKVRLRDIKGSPETYDVAQALTCLTQARDGLELRCPVYDRNLHDPVPDALSITQAHTVVFFEGNYVLCDQPPWSRFRQLFDLAFFVSSSQDVIVPALLDRHRRGGKSEEEARRYVLGVDLRNARFVLRTKRYADAILVKEDRARITRMTIPSSARRGAEAMRSV
jgi:putative kinase